MTKEKLQKRPRKYYPESFNPSNVNEIKEHLAELLNYSINSVEDLILYIKKTEEFISIITTDYAYKYINLTCHTENEEYKKAFNEFNTSIMPVIQAKSLELNKKIYDSEYKNLLDKKLYERSLKIVKNSIELFSEKNIPLNIKDNELSMKYAEISSKMTVDFEGEEKTLAQMGVYQKNQDRSVREKAWIAVAKRIVSESKNLNELYNEMIELRGNIADNVGFDNYRDYMHQNKNRFAYTPQDIFDFHDSVEKEVVPFLKEINKERKQKLNVDVLRPWDTNVDLDGKTLKPFKNAEELVEKTINILSKVDKQFGKQLQLIDNTGLLDLDNRKGKAPGGYNIGLSDYGAAFIFMNSVGLHRNVMTLLHEAGHAMHSYAIADSDLPDAHSITSELAELASMTMELFGLDYLTEFYPDSSDFNKAKKDTLIKTLQLLPSIMRIDAFQQWVYTNPNHTVKERMDYYKELSERFNTGVDWSGLEQYQEAMWLNILHIFQVPFYVIEYAISQLGAISIFKNYKQDPVKTIEQYKEFLSLGGNRSLAEAYEAAGVKFDFSQNYIAEIVKFIKEELKSL